MKLILFFTSLLLSSFAMGQMGPGMQGMQGGQVMVDMNEYMRMQQQNQGGCFNRLLEGYDQNMVENFENHQEQTNMLMDISQKYFEHGKTCRNDLAQSMIQLEQEKLRHQRELNTLAARIKREELKHDQALRKVQRDCRNAANEQFQQFKGAAGQGVVTSERGGPQALFGRNENINKFHRLFENNCMADSLNIDQIKDLRREAEVNTELIEANLKSSADTLAAVTRQLETTQDLTIKTCLEGKEQLEYQESLMANRASAAQSLTKRRGFVGTLQAITQCIGPQSPGRIRQDVTGAGSGTRPAASH